jgi:tetratricopeptide (TPR) repeat protein
LLNKATEEAQSLRLFADVAQSRYLLSILYQETGDLAAAQQATLQAVDASKLSDNLARARQLANTARCLAELGRDIDRARELTQQARTLIRAAGVDEVEVNWCSGLLHNWDGDLDGAAREMERALALASEAEDRWRECKCLGWLAMIELERQRPPQALALAKELTELAHKLCEGAGAPFAQAIEMLARQMSGDRAVDLDGAIAALRGADDKSHLAYVLNLAASLQLDADDAKMATTFATDALTMAETIGEANETALARATLVEAALARNDRKRASSEFFGLQPALGQPEIFSAKVRRALERAKSRFERSTVTK